MMASDAMRTAVERHYGVRLAFQNCHRAAVFRPDATAALAEFTSARAQLLNQSPELRQLLGRSRSLVRTGGGRHASRPPPDRSEQAARLGTTPPFRVTGQG